MDVTHETIARHYEGIDTKFTARHDKDENFTYNTISAIHDGLIYSTQDHQAYYGGGFTRKFYQTTSRKTGDLYSHIVEHYWQGEDFNWLTIPIERWTAYPISTQTSTMERGGPELSSETYGNLSNPAEIIGLKGNDGSRHRMGWKFHTVPYVKRAGGYDSNHSGLGNTNQPYGTYVAKEGRSLRYVWDDNNTSNNAKFIPDQDGSYVEARTIVVKPRTDRTLHHIDIDALDGYPDWQGQELDGDGEYTLFSYPNYNATYTNKGYKQLGQMHGLGFALNFYTSGIGTRQGIQFDQFDYTLFLNPWRWFSGVMSTRQKLLTLDGSNEWIYVDYQHKFAKPAGDWIYGKRQCNLTHGLERQYLLGGTQHSWSMTKPEWLGYPDNTALGGSTREITPFFEFTNTLYDAYYASYLHGNKFLQGLQQIVPNYSYGQYISRNSYVHGLDLGGDILPCVIAKYDEYLSSYSTARGMGVGGVNSQNLTTTYEASEIGSTTASYLVWRGTRATTTWTRDEDGGNLGRGDITTFYVNCSSLVDYTNRAIYVKEEDYSSQLPLPRQFYTAHITNSFETDRLDSMYLENITYIESAKLTIYSQETASETAFSWVATRSYDDETLYNWIYRSVQTITRSSVTLTLKPEPVSTYTIQHKDPERVTYYYDKPWFNYGRLAFDSIFNGSVIQWRRLRGTNEHGTDFKKVAFAPKGNKFTYEIARSYKEYRANDIFKGLVPDWETTTFFQFQELNWIKGSIRTVLPKIKKVARATVHNDDGATPVERKYAIDYSSYKQKGYNDYHPRKVASYIL